MVLVILGICFIIAGLLWYSIELIGNAVQKNITKMCFDSAIYNDNLPVVTFKNKDVALNFLVDTGSNVSHIDSNALCLIEDYSDTDITSTGLVGVESENNTVYRWVNIPLSYKNHTYSEDFCILDLKGPFDSIKEDSNIVLHGILGVSFLKKYRYVLDFKDYKMYRK